MIQTLNQQDCCTTKTNLIEVMKKTHIRGCGLYQCRVCHHADFYPQELFKEDDVKQEEMAHITAHKKSVEVEGK